MELRAVLDECCVLCFRAVCSMHSGSLLLQDSLCLPMRHSVYVATAGCCVVANEPDTNYSAVTGKAQLDRALLTGALAIKVEKDVKIIVCVWRGEEEMGSGHMVPGENIPEGLPHEGSVACPVQRAHNLPLSTQWSQGSEAGSNLEECVLLPMFLRLSSFFPPLRENQTVPLAAGVLHGTCTSSSGFLSHKIIGSSYNNKTP